MIQAMPTAPLPSLSPELLKRIQAETAHVRIGFPFWLRMFLWANVAAITLGRRIYIDPHYMQRGADRIESLVRHELAHVRQVSQLGIMRFAYRYLQDYVRLRRSGLASGAAYEAIPFEIEARNAERDSALV